MSCLGAFVPGPYAERGHSGLSVVRSVSISSLTFLMSSLPK
jgi:hypothetical protein